MDQVPLRRAKGDEPDRRVTSRSRALLVGDDANCLNNRRGVKSLREVLAMKRKRMLTISLIIGILALVGDRAISAGDKYTVKVPGGLAFSEFRGYEAWQAISTSRNEKVVGVILGNPA